MSNIFKVVPWRRLVNVAKPFWVSEKRSDGFVHLVAILALMGLNAIIAVFINKFAGLFMTAVESKNLADFYLFLFAWVAAFLLHTPVHVYYNFMRTRLALIWRKWLGEEFLTRYFSNEAYLRLTMKHDIDNPEQRMTQDVDSFCNSSVGLFMSILDACVHVVTFMTVLWVISPSLSVTVMVYSTLGLVIVSAIGKSLVDLNNSQMMTEGGLRAGLTAARHNAQEIASGGESSETEELLKAKNNLNSVIETLLGIALVNRRIQFFTTPYNLFIQIIPVVIVVPSYFAGEIPFGTITQAAGAFAAVFHGATVLIGQFNGITHYAAITNRLGSLAEAMEHSHELETEKVEVRAEAV